MKLINTRFNGLKLIKSKTYYDKRGFLRETLRNNLLKNNKFIFWIASESKKNTIRGLHIQNKHPQAKFICVLKGKIYDVAFF